MAFAPLRDPAVEPPEIEKQADPDHDVGGREVDQAVHVRDCFQRSEKKQAWWPDVPFNVHALLLISAR